MKSDYYFVKFGENQSMLIFSGHERVKTLLKALSFSRRFIFMRMRMSEGVK